MKKILVAVAVVTMLAVPSFGNASAGFTFSSAVTSGLDPFAGLYGAGAQGGPGYLVLTSSGTNTVNGVTLTIPQTTTNYSGTPDTPYSWNIQIGGTQGTSPNTSTAFNAAGQTLMRYGGDDVSGGGGASRGGPSAALTYSVPAAWTSFDLYIEIVNNNSTTEKGISVNGGPYRNVKDMGNNWSAPTEILEVGDGTDNAGNWMKFTGITATSGTITYDRSYGWKAGMAAIQFVDAVPEPATMSVLVLGGIATLLKRRNRR